MKSEITLVFSNLGIPIISPVISWHDQSWVNHVGVRSFEGLGVIEALPGGVRVNQSPSGVTVDEITVPFDGSLVAFHAFLFDQIGKPYDYLGVLSFPFRSRWQRQDSWFCSELIAAAVNFAGASPPFVQAKRVAPVDIYNWAIAKTGGVS